MSPTEGAGAPVRVGAPRTRVRGGVGESVERPDGAPKVKGEFQYGSDLRREGMLFGATLRSPHPHARILSIDVTAAKKMSGVRIVITSAELPTRDLFGLMKPDQPVLATGRVRYVGVHAAIDPQRGQRSLEAGVRGGRVRVGAEAVAEEERVTLVGPARGADVKVHPST